MRLVPVLVLVPIAMVVATASCSPDREIPELPDGSVPAGLTGLPCEVAEVLARNCLACHGTVPSGGAPMPLVTLADLRAPPPSNPGTTAAAESLARMQDPQRPMPPGRLPPAADVAVMQRFVDDGLPEGSCDSGDGGTIGPTFPHTDPGCLTNVHWTRGDDGDDDMNPGLPCLACHLTDAEALEEIADGEDLPQTIGGTVYGGLREEDRCYGERNVTVEITGNDGRVVRLTTSSSGNFGYTGPLALPYTARVLVGERMREMLTPQTSGDCNGCHTQGGLNGAPGRIVIP